MKKVLFVINTLGGAGAERALLELLKRFSPQQYEIDLYVLLDQGELVSQIPEHVKILNREYSDVSVLSKEGKKESAKYKYPHDYGGWCEQQYLPDKLKDAVYFEPKGNGYEKEIIAIRKEKGKTR